MNTELSTVMLEMEQMKAEMRRTVRRSRVMGGFGLAMVTGALALTSASCAKRAGPPPRSPSPVQTAVAIQMDAPMILTGFGTTSERASVDIVPQVSGTLLKRYFEDGAIVTNGQPLFLVDPADYALRVQQAESMLAADRANRDLAKLTLERNRTLREQ